VDPAVESLDRGGRSYCGARLQVGLFPPDISPGRPRIILALAAPSVNPNLDHLSTRQPGNRADSGGTWDSQAPDCL